MCVCVYVYVRVCVCGWVDDGGGVGGGGYHPMVAMHHVCTVGRTATVTEEQEAERSLAAREWN